MLKLVIYFNVLIPARYSGSPYIKFCPPVQEEADLLSELRLNN